MLIRSIPHNCAVERMFVFVCFRCKYQIGLIKLTTIRIASNSTLQGLEGSRTFNSDSIDCCLEPNSRYSYIPSFDDFEVKCVISHYHPIIIFRTFISSSRGWRFRQFPQRHNVVPINILIKSESLELDKKPKANQTIGVRGFVRPHECDDACGTMVQEGIRGIW